MRIGEINLAHGLMLAPMAGFTDRAMRLVCRKHGAEYSVSEMVSAKAVCYGDKKTHTLARIREDESPVAVQIFGSEPDVMARAAEILSRGEAGGVPPVAIDINMGCPVNKIFSNGEGSALMRSPELIYRIVKAVSGSTDLPTTVKLRAGIDSASRNAVECARACEEGGAYFVAVHGRTRKEMYSGRADLEIIKDVKNSVQIPVIANGDVRDADSAVRLFSETGADGIMIGRGAIGNPFVFEEITARLEGREYTPPTLAERIDTALLELRAAIEDKGETVATREARGRIALYFHSFRGVAELRRRINLADTYAEVERAIYTVIEEN
jgi:tRNA-dihydrouridine synthase B